MSAAKAFVPISREFSGRLSVRTPVDAAFELFSPPGEREWIPGWNPELLEPPDGWAKGQIFRTHEEKGEAVWIITELDREAHFVEYHRVEPGRYVARVRVRCASAAEPTTDVVVGYRFVGLSDDGNADIIAMTPEAYAAKMTRWEQWIGHLVPLKGRSQ